MLDYKILSTIYKEYVKQLTAKLSFAMLRSALLPALNRILESSSKHSLRYRCFALNGLSILHGQTKANGEI